MSKKGFTVAEFVISITIMFLVVASSAPIIMKKSTVTDRTGKNYNTIVCSCAQKSDGLLQGYGTRRELNGGFVYCDIELDQKTKNEFYTVQLIGGGSAGGRFVGGSAGESKVLYLPGMPGKYRISLGLGGRADADGLGGTLKRNGGASAIYKVETIKDPIGRNDREVYKLLAFAQGGIFPGDFRAESDAIGTNLGKTPEFAEQEGGSVCGAGGVSVTTDGITIEPGRIDASDGRNGEVIIRW